MFRVPTKAGFAGCCGINILFGFDENGNYMGTKRTRAAAIEAVQINKDDGVILATLSDGQPKSAEILKKNGFKKLLSFVNPNSDNKVTLFYKPNKNKIKKYK